MKKIQYTLAIAAIAFMASCGAKTESSPTDSPATTTETTPAPAAETTPAPAAETTTPAADDKGTSVNVSKEGASVKTGDTKVEVSKDKLEIKK